MGLLGHVPWAAMVPRTWAGGAAVLTPACPPHRPTQSAGPSGEFAEPVISPSAGKPGQSARGSALPEAQPGLKAEAAEWEVSTARQQPQDKRSWSPRKALPAQLEERGGQRPLFFTTTQPCLGRGNGGVGCGHPGHFSQSQATQGRLSPARSRKGDRQGWSHRTKRHRPKLSGVTEL